MKLIVINSPWESVLPNGTEIINVKAPKQTFKTGRSFKKEYADNWYKRADGVKILERKDGFFRLFTGEIEEV